eukprot:3042459-Amphidinium_carterae.1
MYILWCRCHDHEPLPIPLEAVLPDSDGEYYTDWPEEIQRNENERTRRANQLKPMLPSGPLGKVPRQRR